MREDCVAAIAHGRFLAHRDILVRPTNSAAVGRIADILRADWSSISLPGRLRE
jgi:hypothetical protein